MDENTRITVRLPTEMVEKLDRMITAGKYKNLSEAVRDCIQEYLDSNPEILDGTGEKVPKVEMETLITGDSRSMEDLIREATKKYTQNHIE